ncbi:septation protein SepH [Alloscardovia omnicolens]|uniref:septation protein SepH n=1 Tax=Alloscardovia omnicolens TaxID=419015 RepID=UPI003A61844A
MSENSSIPVTFVRIDENGDILMRDPLTGDLFSLEVTPELERALRGTHHKKQEPAAREEVEPEKILPLSTIQSLIRSGQSSAAIAQEYGVAVSVVDRFAVPVEKEKIFITSQFLDTTVGSEGNASKVKDIIAFSLASLGGEYSEVKWTASRQGHNPWRIQAHYALGEHKESAEWMFNARDHSVVSVNTPAKRLLREISSATSPVDKELFSTDAIPAVGAHGNGTLSGSTSFPIVSAYNAVSTSTGTFETVSMNSMRDETHMSTGAFNAIVSGQSADSLESQSGEFRAQHQDASDQSSTGTQLPTVRRTLADPSDFKSEKKKTGRSRH